MIKGIKTSELWVTLVVLIPWLAKQFGLELPQVIPDDPEALSMLIESARAEVQAASSQVSDVPAWIAAAYVVGRTVLKLKG